jgi:WD40 repeat protein
MGLKAKGTGILEVHELQSGSAKKLTEKEVKAGIKCGTFGASPLEERNIATGDYDGNVAIWDLDKMDAPVWSVNGHKSIINCIDGCGGLNIGGGAPELVTASRDGCVKVWDPRVKDAVVSLEPAEGETARDCWAVAFGNSFSDEDRCVVAGYDNGDVKLFDLRTSTMRWETNVGNGVVGVEFDRKDIEMNKLVVATLESKFRLYDMRTQHPELGFAHLSEKAHKSTVWMARHLPQNRDIFMTTGGNGGLNVYKYTYPTSRVARDEKGVPQGRVGSVELLNSKIVATQPIVGFDWHPDKEGLAVAVSLDQQLRVLITTKLNKY